MTDGSPRSGNRFVVGYYVLSILTGAFFFFLHDKLGAAIEVSAAVLYFAATALLYALSRPRSDQSERTRGKDSV